MPPSIAIINKIKNLLGLSKSPNENEASTAKSLAESLIEKYNVDKTLLTDSDKPYDFLLISLTEHSSWLPKLALLIASQFNVNVFQFVSSVNDGIKYDYYLEGMRCEKVKLVFDSIYLIFNSNLPNENKDYINSYCEGIVEGIKASLIKASQPVISSSSELIKQDCVEKKIDVNADVLIVDIAAFFKGMEVGRNIDLSTYF